MAGQAISYPCGYCGTAVVPGADACPKCGIGLTDIDRHHWGYAAKEAVLESLDGAVDKARELLRRPGAGRILGQALAATAVLGAAAILGHRLRRRRED